MYATRARQARPELFDDRPTIGERLGLAHLDWVLALSAIGLIAFSAFTLGQATTHDIPGSPNYYVERQAIYGVVGVIGMLILARIDYSCFRELRVGIYTFLCVSIALIFVFGFAARGSRRAFEFPFFAFQPSELGKLLLVLALAGFVIDGARRGSAKVASLPAAVTWPVARRSSTCTRRPLDCRFRLRWRCWHSGRLEGIRALWRARDDGDHRDYGTEHGGRRGGGSGGAGDDRRPGPGSCE